MWPQFYSGLPCSHLFTTYPKPPSLILTLEWVLLRIIRTAYSSVNHRRIGFSVCKSLVQLPKTFEEFISDLFSWSVVRIWLVMMGNAAQPCLIYQKTAIVKGLQKKLLYWIWRYSIKYCALILWPKKFICIPQTPDAFQSSDLFVTRSSRFLTSWNWSGTSSLRMLQCSYVYCEDRGNCLEETGWSYTRPHWKSIPDWTGLQQLI